jgi:aminoglycoside 3-N-acetyltransferase
VSEAKRKALIESLHKLGIGKGDIVMVHSDVSRFLKLPLQTNQRLKFLLDTLLEAVPQGTLVVPTFSYRFCRGQPFDSRTTPSEVGLFSEFTRGDPRAMRSAHPIFSVAAIGPDAPYLCRNLSNSSYGPGSVFERLYAAAAKLLHFDVTVADTCTFAHFPEQRVGVPYRYSKYFRGTTTFDGASSVGDWEFYVRAIERWDFPPQVAAEMRYPRDAEAKGHSATATWEGLPITVATCRGIFDVISSGLRADPNYMITGTLRPKQAGTSAP